MELKEAIKLLKEVKAFHTRLESLQQIKDTVDTYPVEFVCLGFRKLIIKDKEELDGRIKELSEMLHLTLEED